MDPARTENDELEIEVEVQNQNRSQEKDQLLKDLDDLWVVYLRTLDSYFEARKDLSSSLAAGYLSLAQANYASRTRFGRDQYDDRIQATVRVKVEERNGDKLQSPFTLSTNLRLSSLFDSSENENNGTQQALGGEVTEDCEIKGLKNPLSMFGLLVPSSLRTAQGNFANTIGSITKLCDIVASLKLCESKILQLRDGVTK